MKIIPIIIIFCLAILLVPKHSQLIANESFMTTGDLISHSGNAKAAEDKKLALKETHVNADSLVRKKDIVEIPTADKGEENKKFSPMSFNFIYYIIYKFKDIDLSSLIPRAGTVFR